VQDIVRPELKRPEYEEWVALAPTHGYSKSGKGLWRLVRVMMDVAKETRSLFRKVPMPSPTTPGLLRRLGRGGLSTCRQLLDKLSTSARDADRRTSEMPLLTLQRYAVL